MYAAFHSVGLPREDILALVARVSAAGYHGLELNAETLPWADPHVTPQTDTNRRRAIVSACRAAGLSIPAVGAHIFMVGEDKAGRKAAIDFVNGCTDLAADMGAPVVHILSGEQPAGVDRATAWRWFADAVSRTTAHAQAKGVVLAIEAIAGHMFRSTDDYHALARDLPGVPFKVNYDPSHLVVQGEDPLRPARELADRIVHVHMKDGAGRYPDFTFPPLGRGAIDFARLVAELRGAGYAGALSVEYEAQVYGFTLSDDEILTDGRNFLRDLGV